MIMYTHFTANVTPARGHCFFNKCLWSICLCRDGRNSL